MKELMVRVARVLVHRPKASGCAGCGILFVAILAAVVALITSRCSTSPDEAKGVPVSVAEPEIGAEVAPRLLLSRGWFDKLPEKRGDAFDLWIFFGGGVGLHRNGSSFRGSFDWFDFERQGSKIDARWFQDKKRFKTGFSIRRCDDHAPFTLCLTLENLDGKKVELYGFHYDEEMEKAMPGASRILAAARTESEQTTKESGSGSE